MKKYNEKIYKKMKRYKSIFNENLSLKEDNLNKLKEDFLKEIRKYKFVKINKLPIDFLKKYKNRISNFINTYCESSRNVYLLYYTTNLKDMDDIENIYNYILICLYEEEIYDPETDEYDTIPIIGRYVSFGNSFGGYYSAEGILENIDYVDFKDKRYVLDSNNYFYIWK